jgi:hypothetical protein
VVAKPAELLILEADAARILEEARSGGEDVFYKRLKELEALATQIAKLAYGQGHPEWLSPFATHLIAWTDHLDDSKWKSCFAANATSKELCSPWDWPGLESKVKK